MSGVEVIAYEPALNEELVEFRRTTYETGFPESRDYLTWKYVQNPYLSGPLFYLARANGRIVGMRGIYGTCWEYGHRREAAVLPCADDFAIAPEFRNTGLATQIMRAVLADLVRRGYDYVINTSGGRITAMSSLAAGWRSACAVEPMVRRSRSERVRVRIRTRVRATRLIWRLARSSSANIISSTEPFQRIDRMGRVAAKEPNAFIVAERLPRVDDMAALVHRLPYDGRIRQVRDVTFLAWRYQNPVRQYRFFHYERDGRLEGYLVLARHVECQLPTLPFHLVDWEGSSDVVRSELLHHATNVANIAELGAWAVGLSTSDRALLAQEGFVPTDLDMRNRGMPCILVKSLGNDPPEAWTLGGGSILESARWDPRLVYTMHG